MRLRILSIGRERRGAIQSLVEEYLGRLAHYLPVEAIVAGESHGEDSAARRAEGALLRRHLPAKERFVALDERGELLTSPGLAERLNDEARRGLNRLTFVLGGASGLESPLRAEAAWVLSLSPLTFPHQLARLLLVEQLYRAQTILRGERYSK